MPHHGTETDFELTTIERFSALGYGYVHGEELARDRSEVVLLDRLRSFLSGRYPYLTPAALDEAVRVLSRPEGVDTLRRNKSFHEMLTRGVEIAIEREDGVTDYPRIYPVDWENPAKNDFLVVNQLSVSGCNDRRPDIVVYVNGLPLVLFELKNPWGDPTVDHALNQISHYRHHIPQLFEFNALTVVSDGVSTLHGMWPSSLEWFAPWRSIDGRNTEPATTGSMKALVEGLFPKERLLSYIRDFIVFEVASDKVTKKGAKYHQFFAVNIAVQKTLETFRAEKDRRIGVIWHTTGSGKSLSMAFLVGILRRKTELENPTFVVQVDRTDLDNQLFDQFVAARSLVGEVKQAESVDHLRDMLRTEGGEVIFTTIEKFRLKADLNEISHPVLSERSNVIILADEAHRTQYGFKQGFARYLAEALPNAKRLGFTGTPISFSGADTEEIFGECIHTYDIKQSQEDKATVKIFYAPRMVKLHLKQADIDRALSELTEDESESDLSRKKSKWASLAAAVGAKDRLDELAVDLLAHFKQRTATLEGKAMVVCMTRENCVRLYEALKALDGCPEMKIIMTGDLGKDPEEWSKAGYLTTKPQREAIKKRMIDVDDPLKIAIVCDMWLTGTDIPCLHTLYVDKPMKGHNLIQAISRVNRVFRDKPHGLIVDYIGIGDELREATSKYTKGGGEGNPAPDVTEEALPLFKQHLAQIREILPEGIDYGDWRNLSNIELEDRYSLVYGLLTDDGEREKSFKDAEQRLSQSFLLVQHLDECRGFADEIIFYQRVRKQLNKIIDPISVKKELDRAVRDLVDDNVESEGVVDIFEAVGLEKADISILDDNFLQTFKDKPHENLRLKLLEMLLRDEIRKCLGRNVKKGKSFKEMLETILAKYHNRLIDAAAVIRAMIEIKKDLENDTKRATELGLEEEELAFYDAVAENVASNYDQIFIRDLIHQVVQAIKRNLKVDWTEPHREDVKAGVLSAVKMVLRKNKVRPEDFDKIIPFVMEQAEAIYANWPVAA